MTGMRRRAPIYPINNTMERQQHTENVPLEKPKAIVDRQSSDRYSTSLYAHRQEIMEENRKEMTARRRRHRQPRRRSSFNTTRDIEQTDDEDQATAGDRLKALFRPGHHSKEETGKPSRKIERSQSFSSVDDMDRDTFAKERVRAIFGGGNRRRLQHQRSSSFSSITELEDDSSAARERVRFFLGGRESTTPTTGNRRGFLANKKQWSSSSRRLFKKRQQHRRSSSSSWSASEDEEETTTTSNRILNMFTGRRKSRRESDSSVDLRGPRKFLHKLPWKKATEDVEDVTDDLLVSYAMYKGLEWDD